MFCRPNDSTEAIGLEELALQSTLQIGILKLFLVIEYICNLYEISLENQGT